MENSEQPKPTFSQKLENDSAKKDSNYTKIAIVAAGVSAAVALTSVGIEKAATGHLNRITNEDKDKNIETKTQGMPTQNIDLNKPVDLNQIKQDKPNPYPETFGTKVAPKDIK